ncbi:MAG: FecR domain-containing protein [Rubrivivax sp.]
MPLPRLLAAGLLSALVGAAWAADEPPLVSYVTQPGDTLIGIGRLHFVEPARWPEVQRLNRIADPRRMPVGVTLSIPLALLRTESAPGLLTAASGQARMGGALLAAGQAVPEGSEIVTGPDGSVTVRLVDGTLLRLRAAGRLRVDESRRTTLGAGTRSGVRLDQGRVEIEAAPARGGQPGFRIGTPQGVMAVRGTEFRVAVDEAGSRGEVLEGAVGVTGRGAEQRVAAGFGTVIDAAGQVASPVALLGPPDLSGLPARHERPLVRLQLPARPGVQGYRVQVGADEAFERLLADVSVAGGEVRLAGLDDGRHPMRVRAIGERGLEGRDTRVTLWLKARPEPPLPRAPAPRTVIVGSAAAFAWAASSEAARYRLQLARADAGADPFAAPLRDMRDITAPELALDGLAPGAYLWRLASVRADGDQGPFGDASGFEVRALPPQPAPPGPPSVGDEGVRLFWQGQPGQRFDFQLARDAGFAQLLIERQLQTTEIELPLPGDGRFHVRLRVRDADGFVGPWSASQHFDVVPCVRTTANACVRVGSGAVLQRP